MKSRICQISAGVLVGILAASPVAAQEPPEGAGLGRRVPFTVPAAAEEFRHPAGAYTLPLPDGWNAHWFVDSLGHVNYSISQNREASDRSEKFRNFLDQALRDEARSDVGKPPEVRLPRKKDRRTDGPVFDLYAIPILPGFSPTLDSSAPFAALLATADSSAPFAARLAATASDLKAGRDAKFGKLDGRAFALTGKSLKEFKVSGAKLETVYTEFRGELRIAVGNDYLYVAYVIAPEEDWDALRAKYEAALAGFSIPAPEVFTGAPPKPPERAQDVEPRLVPVVPQVFTLCRLNPDDPDVNKLVIGFIGSGVILTEDGYVVTNRHVVERQRSIQKTASGERTLHRFPYDPVRLRWAPETKLEPEFADVVAISHVWDLALLRIRSDRKWSTVPMADPQRVRRLHDIVVAGWPSLDDRPDEVYTAVPGSLSAFHPHTSDDRPSLYQHNARTTNGNSGGLVYDLDLGGIIGVHSLGLISTAKKFKDQDGTLKTLGDVVAHGAIPLARVLEEFPQLLPGPVRPQLTSDDRAVRVATFFQAGRLAAAQVECEQDLRQNHYSSTANWFKFRILSQQGEPESVTEPLLKLAESDPATVDLAAIWKGRASLETADWQGLRQVLDANWFGDGGVKESVSYSGLNQIEADQLLFYYLGRCPDRVFNGVLLPNDQFATAKVAEAQVMDAIDGLRRWMLEKRVTALPGKERPTPEQASEWRRLLALGRTRWPSFHAMAGLYMAYLDAALGNTEEADKLFELSLASGRRDRFFQSNAVYYCLLRKKGVHAYLLAAEAHSPISPGTHFLLGQSMRQLAGQLHNENMKDEKTAELANRLGQWAKDMGLIPADTKTADLADRLEMAGERVAVEGLVRIRHISQYPELEVQRRKLPEPLVREDNWWGPFVYLQHDRVWRWQSDPMEKRWSEFNRSTRPQ